MNAELFLLAQSPPNPQHCLSSPTDAAVDPQKLKIEKDESAASKSASEAAALRPINVTRVVSQEDIDKSEPPKTNALNDSNGKTHTRGRGKKRRQAQVKEAQRC